MRGAVTSHDGHILLREDRSTRAQKLSFSKEELLLFGKKKIERFASSGISGRLRLKNAEDSSSESRSAESSEITRNNRTALNLSPS